MVKINAKRFLAAIVATTMVVGSSVTVFAEGESTPTPGTATGSGTYEGNDVGYDAPTVTLPTIASGTLNFITDPNGLIRQSNAAAYSGYTFEGDTGLFFLTDSTGKKYTQNSSTITAYNKSAYPLSVTVTLEQSQAGTDVTFNGDKTFANSTNKEVYLALVDKEGTAVPITTTTSGENTTVNPATFYSVIPGKPGNYKLIKGSSGYEYTYVTGVTADDNTKWNAFKVRVTGAANLKAGWDNASAVPPTVTMTWAIAADPAPVKIIADTGDTTVTLTHAVNTTISSVKWGEVDLKTNTYSTVTNPSKPEGSESYVAGNIVFKAACVQKLYTKAEADGAVVDIVYADGFKEQVVFVKKY